jgi:hypothetical protein
MNESKYEFDNREVTPWADVVKFYRENFNTQLSHDEEWKFHIWMDELDMEDRLNDYDLRGAWKDGAMAKDNLPSKYKKPNNLTFDETSIYSGQPDLHNGGEYEGGQWGATQDGCTTFRPSMKMLKTTHPDKWIRAELAISCPEVKFVMPEDCHE